MNSKARSTMIAALAALFLASCGGMRQVAQQEDDIYFMPSSAPVASAKAEPSSPTKSKPAEPVVVQDDYYDTGTATQYAQPRGFYDMTYNDPYYYNYGRFGFGSGYGSSLGIQTGMGMGPNGFPMRWGFGTGVYSGWSGSNFSMGMNYGNSGYGGWNQFGWYNDPYYMGYGNNYMGYGGWNNGFGGYGYGNYYGPYGNCACCYTPVIVGGSSNVVVQHRPSTGMGGGTSGGSVGQTRARFIDPVGLAPDMNRGTRANTGAAPNGRDLNRTISNRPEPRGDGARPVIGERPSTRPGTIGNEGGSNRGSISMPSRSGGGNGGGSGVGGGGGSRPTTPGRVR